MPEANALISVASNIEPERHIPEALALLSQELPITGISTFYQTRPIDRPEQADYLNGVIRVRTTMPPRELKFDILRPIESQLGRIRSEDRYASRRIDLDLLLFGDHVINEKGLSLPDPDICQRPFLAAGILELEPAIILPGTGARLKDLTDPTGIRYLNAAARFSRELQERFMYE